MHGMVTQAVTPALTVSRLLRRWPLACLLLRKTVTCRSQQLRANLADLGHPVFFFFFKQETAYEVRLSLVGSVMCIGDRGWGEAC